MNQNKPRIEPTFGDKPQVNESSQNTANIKSPVSISVSSNRSPGHTFTPVLKRPVEAAQTLSTLEEKAMLKDNLAQTKPLATEQPSGLKAAGFAFAPVEEEVAQESTVKLSETQPPKADATTPAAKEPASIERVMPTHQSPAKKVLADKVPAKFRRLLLVILLALAGLLLVFLLKPKTSTVEDLQEQGTSLPIEFRPVDEAEAKRAEEEARALQQAQQEQQAAVTASSQGSSTADTTAVDQTPAQPTLNAEPSATLEQPATTPAVVPTTAKPVSVEPVKKPETSGSVIYQPETAKAEAKKVERLKPATPKAEVVKVEKPVSVKPKAETATPVVKRVEPNTVAAVSSKTLFVPKGVSLMQVFRDNNLNIADVNAMSKVNGAVSNLKAGEKVTLQLDKNGRVAEMSIRAGKYIRQTNGTYLFK